MTVSDNITRRPLLPVITLKKNDATLYTYNPFTPTFDFRVIRLQVSPPYSNVSGTFTLELTSSDGSNANANTLISNVDEGNEVTIWIGKTDASKMKIFTGVIESWKINESNKNFMYLTISGPDFGSDILQNRIVTGQWAQELDSNGDVVTTDEKTTIRQIVLDLLTETKSYPTGEVTAEDQGISVTSTNIEGDDLKLKAFNANYEFLGDKLQALDDINGTVHFVDPEKVFYMKFPETVTGTSSGILLTDDNTDATAIAWLPQTKVGLIAPGSEYIRTLEDHKRAIFGMGGISIAPDQSQETDGASATLETYHYAESFTPNFNTINKIKLKLSKIGTPVEDFVMELREDISNTPTGSVLRSVSKDKNFLNQFNTTATWITFEINEEIKSGSKYWIVVKKNGTSASHTFRWHHNNDAGAAMRSTNDVSWASGGTVGNFCFVEYKGEELVLPLEQNGNIVSTDKHIHEDTIRKDYISDSQTLQNLISKVADTAFKRKEILKCNVYAPDVLLTAGQKVYVRKTASGYVPTDPITGNTIEMVIGQVDYIFESSDDQSTGNFYYSIEAVRFVAID